MRSISEELSELKTSLWGYDKEAVQLLIRQILLENEEELEKETSKLIKQNRSLELELNESRERLELMTKQFEHLSEKLDRMTEVMGKGTEYSKERDQELREFHKKETEIETLYEKAQQEAMAERDRLLADVEKEQEALMEQAQAERNALIEEGKARKQQLIQEGMEEKQHLEDKFGVRIPSPFFQAEFRSAAAYFQPHHAEEEWSHASADITLDFYFFDIEGGRRGWTDTVQHI